MMIKVVVSNHCRAQIMNHKLFKDLTGMKFGRLTVIEFAERKNKCSYWICKCDCGTIKKYIAANIKTTTQSCGCLQIEKTKKANTKHGMKGSSTYKTWRAMKSRCLNPNFKFYKYYGGRGITICDRWIESFENFYADMGERPKGKTLDRINNNLGYSKENCRWATDLEQSRNRNCCA